MGTISESKVIQRLEELLEAIDEPARDRVLAWANSRWWKSVNEFATSLLPSVSRVVESGALPTVGGTMLGQAQVSRDGVVVHSDSGKEQRRG